MKKENLINNDSIRVYLPKQDKIEFIESCKIVDREERTSGPTIRKFIRDYIEKAKLKKQ